MYKTLITRSLLISCLVVIGGCYPYSQQQQIEQLQEELNNEKDKFLRLFAEFENYKRRTAKERIDLFRTANQEVLQALLPVLDDFDRAMIQIAKSEDEVLLKGVELIHEK